VISAYSHDIDSAELLADHDCPGGDIGPSESGDGEDIAESGKVVCALEGVFLFQDLAVGVKLKVSSCSDTGVLMS
jgi:hypothetical protein